MKFDILSVITYKIIFLYEFINYKCAILLSGTGKEA